MLADLFRGEDFLLGGGDDWRRPLMRNSRATMRTTIHIGAIVALDQRDQRRGDENLVGQRVEQLAEIGDEIARARDGVRRPSR